ncbi:ABC transporter [Clostridium carboxidivorans P7]|uniref:ABC-2 type transporter n=1 Tax=Clostridium carboxidivorans P7 TaxID=536227 RepID=C6PY95_9CLOT|nr:ABC transporter permease [Clostridium carboxidivorans]AKN32060.1 ABC transporter [Clostridium carboxidivorans P7]EET85771.1 ABC-2 type transporter [Clostridium carboxidivorans P7]EFG87797.1 ABC-2 type transporter [Clostridium carboxidivorans P7]
MDFSIRRVNALFIKELKDFFQNPNILVMFMMPIMFAILYGKMMGTRIPKVSSLEICLLLSLTMVGCSSAACLIAEEKEKNTLRTLMLSPLSPIEFLTGKSLISLLSCMVSSLIVFFIVSAPNVNLFLYIIISLISSITIIILGLLIGLLCKSQLETGIASTPIIMILMLVPMFSGISSALKNIANFCFTYHALVAIYKISEGKSLLDLKLNLLNIFVWFIVSSFLLVFVYKKVSLDK